MKASELKKIINEQLNHLGKDDFEVVLKCDGWIYDISFAYRGYEENGREDYETEHNVIILKASE